MGDYLSAFLYSFKPYLSHIAIIRIQIKNQQTFTMSIRVSENNQHIAK